MKKGIYIIFLALCLFLCLLPSVGMLIKGESMPAANEILAARPKLTNPVDGSFNMEVLAETQNYFGDRFAFRQEMVTLQAEIYAKLFHSSITPEVTVGRDGWLYYTEGLDDVLAQNTMSDRQLFAAVRNLQLIEEYVNINGADFLFVCAPNKASIYPGHLNNIGRPLEGPNNRHMLFGSLDSVSALDLTDSLAKKAKDSFLYYETDSHWTPQGAALGADEIYKKLGRENPLWFESGFSQAFDHTGDLYEMLYPKGRDFETGYNSDRGFSFEPSDINPSDITINTRGSGQGSLLMFRDSFGDSLFPYMAEGFERSVFSRSNPFALNIMMEESFDTVVVEIVERNLEWLAEKPPVLPAILRQAEALPELSAAQDAQPMEINAAASQIKGYTHISGSLENIDADSNIYIQSGGELYEALPMGEEGFSCHLPEEEASQLRIFYKSGTEWRVFVATEI